MARPLQSRTLKNIRQDIGTILGVLITGTATSTVDASSLLDTYGLVKGGTNEYRGRQVVIVTPVGSIVAGSKSFVASSVSTDATCAPVFLASITLGDAYEMWSIFLQEEINTLINLAIMEVSDDCLQLKQTTDIITLEDTYEYALTSFKGLNRVEYAESIGIDHLLSDCETAWTGGTGTTSTADATFKKKGTYCSKNVVVGVGATTILCYTAITSVDISDCDKIEFWMYSSIALTAGQLQIHLSSTAAIASAEETIDFPAMTAATWYRHSLSMEAPHSDSAIISIGIYQVANVADFTFYVDKVDAVLANSKVYKELNPQWWDVVKGSTPKLRLAPEGLEIITLGALLSIFILVVCVPSILPLLSTE